jgi:MFS superfamily sulfate permease-like transporter
VLPKGFPPLTIPHVGLADLGPLFAGALGIALVSLADTISTASAQPDIPTAPPVS